MEHFGILHFFKAQGSSQNELIQELEQQESSFIKFETCMRKIYFFQQAHLDKNQEQLLEKITRSSHFEYMNREVAYTFVLEVITGLKSNIKGETEIFGQFKAFCETVKSKKILGIGLLQQIFDQLIIDCKYLRDKHIKNWGSQSYGSLSRKLLDKGTPVFLLGSGQLAKEISPWLEQIPNKYLVVRDLTKTYEKEFQNFQKISYDNFRQLSSGFDTTINLIIAAPLVNEDLSRFFNRYRLKTIIDWRGDQKISSSLCETYFHLSHIKGALAESEESLSTKVNLVKQEIQVLVEKWGKKIQLNPWGWDDICA